MYLRFCCPLRSDQTRETVAIPRRTDQMKDKQEDTPPQGLRRIENVTQAARAAQLSARRKTTGHMKSKTTFGKTTGHM